MTSIHYAVSIFPRAPRYNTLCRGKKPQLQIPDEGATVSATCDVTGTLEARGCPFNYIPFFRLSKFMCASAAVTL